MVFLGGISNADVATKFVEFLLCLFSLFGVEPNLVFNSSAELLRRGNRMEVGMKGHLTHRIFVANRVHRHPLASCLSLDHAVRWEHGLDDFLCLGLRKTRSNNDFPQESCHWAGWPLLSVDSKWEPGMEHAILDSSLSHEVDISLEEKPLFSKRNGFSQLSQFRLTLRGLQVGLLSCLFDCLRFLLRIGDSVPTTGNLRGVQSWYLGFAAVVVSVFTP